MQSLRILYTFVLRAEKRYHISIQKYIKSTNVNTKVYKIRKLHVTVFSTFYDILQPNFIILLNL